jgi:hypothetical protein
MARSKYLNSISKKINSLQHKGAAFNSEFHNLPRGMTTHHRAAHGSNKS